MEEIWKDIKGYEQLYQVSNLGRVKSLEKIDKSGKIRKGKLLKPAKSGRGKYKVYKVVLYNGKGEKTTYAVHRLVALTFLDNPNNLPCINHKDENPANNQLSNLEWCTVKYNNNYGESIQKKSEANKQVQKNNPKKSKIVLQYDLNGNFIQEWPSSMEIQRQLGYFSTAIRNCCLGRIVKDSKGCNYQHKSAYGYIWKYK